MQKNPSLELYLQTPPFITDVALIREALKEMLDTGHVSALLCHSFDSYALAKSLKSDVALILPWNAESELEADIDGIHIFDKNIPLKPLRQKMKEASIGIGPLSTKHDAMEAGELGVDYVSFSAHEPELISWWAQQFIVPCVAWGITDQDHAKEMKDAGADFIMPAPVFWKDPLKNFESLIKIL